MEDLENWGKVSRFVRQTLERVKRADPKGEPCGDAIGMVGRVVAEIHSGQSELFVKLAELLVQLGIVQLTKRFIVTERNHVLEEPLSTYVEILLRLLSACAGATPNTGSEVVRVGLHTVLIGQFQNPVFEGVLEDEEFENKKRATKWLSNGFLLLYLSMHSSTETRNRLL